MEDGESIPQAAIREVYEETGLEIELTSLVGIYYRAQSWSKGGSHVFVFSAKPISGKLTPQKGEILEIGYFSPTELPQPLFWGHHRRIKDALNGVGGSVAWSQEIPWPFEPGLTRKDIYVLRDKSGLSRRGFFEKHFVGSSHDNDTLELG